MLLFTIDKLMSGSSLLCLRSHKTLNSTLAKFVAQNPDLLYTTKRFRLLQPYFGHLSYIPFVCVTCKVQGALTI